HVGLKDIDESTFSNLLDLGGMPDPDLLIRTGGEKRVSNFLLWNLAYTELYFTETYWPDFDRSELLKAIEDYSRRIRKFGAVLQE
ncbi:MAG: undecaprenyl diphosphate synthase family protein, partial [Hydrogenobacter sp.]